MDYAKCEGCPMDGECEPLGAIGARDAPFLFVTDIPSAKSAEAGRLLSTQAVNLIASHMTRLGFGKKDFAFYPYIRCPHDPNTFTAKERRAIATHCRAHLNDFIAKMHPEVIIPLGGDPASAVVGRAVKISKIRGVPAHSDEHNAMILPMFGPGFILLYPQNEPAFASDCNTLARLVDHDMDIEAASRETVGDYEYIDDLQFLIDMDPEIVAFDTETTSLSWFQEGCDVRTYDPRIHKGNPLFAPRAQILTMQFTVEEGAGYMLPWDHPDAPQTMRSKARLKKQLRELLCRPGRTVIGQNLKYDAVMTATQTGVRFKIGGDTMMLATLIDENSTKNLDDLTKRYVPAMAGYADRFNLVVDKSRMWEVPLGDDFLEYGCLSYASLVQLGDGSWRKIGELVDTRYDGLVMSVSEDGRVVQSRVVGWWDNGVTEEWYKLHLVGGRSGRWGVLGPKFTADHEVITDRGRVPVGCLQPGDRILTTESAYTDDQQQVLLGTLLGDGGYSSRNNGGAGLRLGQASAREAYARWKADTLMPEGYSIDDSGGTWRATAVYGYRDAEMAEWARKVGLRNGVKGIHPHHEVLNLLSDLGIAVWYGDDGTLLPDGESCRIYCKVDAVNGGRVAAWFQRRLGADVSYLSSQGAICFSRAATNLLHQRIARYTHPDVQYKLLDRYRGSPCPTVDTEGGRFYASLVEVIPVRPDSGGLRDRTRYCITVEDTHNFVTESGVVRNCGDTDSTFRLYDHSYAEVSKDKRLINHYHYVSLPGLNAFASIEMRGLHVNEDEVEAFEAYMEESVAEQRRNLLEQVPKSIKRKQVIDWENKVDSKGKTPNKGKTPPLDKLLKPGRADFIHDILFYHRDGFRLTPKVWTKGTAKLDDDRKVPSTSTKDHLPYFFDECPFVMELAKYIKDERLLGTNVQGFKKKYIINGMVRSSYSLTKAVTGRSSSESPNCFPGYVEVLTRRGWVRFDEASPDEEVAQYDFATGEIDFASPLDYVSLPFRGRLVGITTEQHIDIVSTKNHRFTLIDRKTGALREVTADSYLKDALQVHAGVYVGGHVTYTSAQVTLICALQADGHVMDGGHLDWGFSKARKADRLEQALRIEGVPYRRSTGSNGRHRFYVSRQHVPAYLTDKKRFGPWILDMDRPTLSAFCDELFFWDGDSTRRRTWVSSVKSNADWVQIAYALSGTRAWTKEASNASCASFHIVNTTEGRRYSGTASRRLRSIPHRGYVYCFTMPKDTLVVRHNGRVHITNNSQNFPKRGENATRYRRLFIAPPGHYILEADLSQAELRISADMARDHTMLSIYRNNGDIHTSTALIVMGVTQAQFDRLEHKEQKLARFKAKAVNFGFIYGMGWRKFIGYAKTQYGVEFTEKEAQRIRAAFFDTYSALPQWHARMREFVRQHGFVRSYSGRIRHLPTIGSAEEFIQQEAERQAINSPVQEFGSSLGVMATGRINEEIDDRYLAPVAFVHDAIYCYVPCEYLLWGARMLKWYMESNRIEEWFGVRLQVPIVADVGFGVNMGDTYELKGLKFREPFDFGQFEYDESDPEQVKAHDGLPSIIVPPQKTPPGNGKRSIPLYSYVDDELVVREVANQRRVRVRA